jgi:hypothetical protein
MIGLSLSFCVKDILAGHVPESDVTKIITSTAARTEADWNRLITSYCQIYWKAFESDVVIALIQRLRVQGKIEQPRLADPEHFHPIPSIWIADADLEQDQVVASERSRVLSFNHEYLDRRDSRRLPVIK